MSDTRSSGKLMWLGSRVVLVLIVASMVACNDETRSVTPTSTATGAPPVDSTAAATVGSGSTTAPVTATDPRERRIGIDALDELASAIVAADAAFIEGVLEYVQIPCTAESNPIPGPVCATGVAVGAPIDVFALSGCHFSYEPAASIGPVVDGFAVSGLALFAVYRAEPHDGDRVISAGDYVLVFVRLDSRLVAVAANADGGIVQWTGSCGVTDPSAFLAELPIAEDVLPPVE